MNSNQNIGNLYFCFDIQLKNKNLKLTNRPNNIYHNNETYYPGSSLSVEHISKDITGKNNVVITGIYDTHGISKDDNSKGAGVLVQYYADQKKEMYSHIYYFCTKAIINNLTFKMYLEPISYKLDRSISLVYSNICRASFGDKYCTVDKNKFSQSYHIESVSDNIMVLSMLDEEKTGYYDNGSGFVVGKNIDFKIIKHISNKIIINLSNHSIVIEDKVTIFPGCDKNLSTCHRNFNNSVNYRGEPYMSDLPRWAL